MFSIGCYNNELEFCLKCDDLARLEKDQYEM
jgi:hypothetical protein